MEDTNTTTAPVTDVQATAAALSPDKPAENAAQSMDADTKKVAKTFREALADNFFKEKNPAVEPNVETPPADATKEPAPEFKVEDVVVAPLSLKAEERQYFENLPPELKKFVARREQEITRMGHERAERIAAMEKEMAPALEHFKRYESDYIREGINPMDVVRRSIEWDRALKQNPKEAAYEFLKTYGIEPADLVLDIDAEQFDEPQQPGLTADEIREQIRQELLAENEKKQAEYLLAENMRVAGEFLNATPFAKDPSSLTELDKAMMPIVARLVTLEPSRDKREILNDAYDHVTKSDPRFSTIRSQYEQAQAAAKAREESAKAAFAGRSITGAAGGTASPMAPRSFRENLKWRMQGGVS